VFYDIGANLGFFSVLLGRLVGTTGLVYSFEPVPANAAMIERNARLNGLNNIKVMRIACSREARSSELLLAHYAGGAVLKGAGVPPDLAGSLMVETSSIDILVESQQIKPPNLVKIDVEGAEMDVLQGMEKVLRKWAPAILLEVDDATAAGCQEKLLSYRKFLHDRQYQTELLPNSYVGSKWSVQHFVALRGTS
jgi:FkbM family methyltransferase